jgi:integrase
MLRRKDVTRMVAGVSGARSKQFAYVMLKAAVLPYVRAVGPIDQPFPTRSTPRVPKHVVPPFDREGIARILAAIRGTALEVFVVLALASGLRQSELLGLTWGDVRDGHLVVWRQFDEYTRALGATKTDGSRRRNDLPAIVMRTLADHRARDVARGLRVDEGDYLFRNRNGKPIDASNLRRAWRNLRIAHDLPPLFRLYDLRHAHASLLAEAGVASKVIAERLGHASTRLTDDTYSHLMPGMQSAASAIVGAILDEAAGEPPTS